MQNPRFASGPSAPVTPNPTANRRDPGIRTFLTVWAGVAISLLGSVMTTFALGVWMFERTGSVTRFSLVLFVNVLPSFLLMPVVGALIDRWNRRTALLVGAVGGGVASLVLALLFLSGRLEEWHVYVLVGLGSIAQAFRWPTLGASVVLLVPARELSRANGLVQLGMALAQTLAPLLAGALMAPIGVGGILLFDAATALVALATLFAVRIPRPAGSAASGTSQPLLAQFAASWRYLGERPGLMALLVLFAVTNFSMGLVVVLTTPLVLGFADARVLGTVVGVASGGLVAGSILMTVWRGPVRRVRAILAIMALQGLVLALCGFQPSAALIAATSFVFVFGFPIAGASSQAIWQSKVAPEIQGRIFALRQMIAFSALPLSRLAAGPLADRVFEPLLAPGGLLAGSVGQVLGVGPGRGIGFLFVVLGLANVAAVAIAWSSPRLRNIEEEIPSHALAAEPSRP